MSARAKMEFRIDMAGVHAALEEYRRSVREEQDRLAEQPSFHAEWRAANAEWEKMRNWMLHCGGKAQWRTTWRGTRRRRRLMPIIPEETEYLEGDEKQIRKRRGKVLLHTRL